MDLVYLGSGQFGLECLNAVRQSGHNLRLIVTQPSRQAGRGRKPKATAAAQWASGHSVDFVETDNVNSPEIIEQITGCNPELIIVIAFGQKIGQQLMELAPKGIINVHASLLPKYRGAAPINWPIINGDRQTGVSIVTVTEKMDAGDILGQVKTDIEADETAGRLHNRLAQLSPPLLIEAIEKIASGTAVYQKQDHCQATNAPKLKKSDGFVNFAEPAEILRRKILGFWPWPAVRADYHSKKTGKSTRVSIAQAQTAECNAHEGLKPGVLDANLNVICGSGALKITKIKPAGAGLMSFKDFANGRNTRAGDFFAGIEQ